MEAHPRRKNRQQPRIRSREDDLLFEAAVARGALEGASNPEFADDIRQEFKDIAKESLDRVLVLARDKYKQQLVRKILESKRLESAASERAVDTPPVHDDRKAA